MNAVGKTLVILNFLFAIVVGVLVVMNAAVTNQWKLRYENLVREATALRDGRGVDNGIRLKVNEDFKAVEQQKLDLTQKLSDRETEFKTLADRLNQDISDLKLQLDDAKITVKDVLKAKQRLTDEIAKLNSVIKEREVLVVRLEADNKVFRLNSANFEQMNNALKIRNENLLENIRTLTQRVAQLESGANPDTDVIANPNQPNPPANKIDGKIEVVNDSLVQVSLGSDHGLRKNNTLDVYRVQPNAKYLGMIRIVDVRAHSSVGRLVPMGNVQFRPQLKAGDLVTSKLTR